MNISLQQMLMHIPFHERTFHTPLPKGPIYYDQVYDQLPDKWFDKKTLLVLKDHHIVANLSEAANKLIQDANVIGLLLCTDELDSTIEETSQLFWQFSIPVIQLKNERWFSFFQSPNLSLFPYNQLSIELVGFMERGLIDVAEELAYVLETPFLYLNERNEIIWETGNKEELTHVRRWFNTNQRDIEQKVYDYTNISEKNEHLYERYPIPIGGIIHQYVIVRADLSHWQKQFVDKFVGLAALLLQTEGMFQEQQEKMKQHFVYDLLFHKFESQTEMVKQGKNWGWNLERPHHLMIVHVDLDDFLLIDVDWMGELIVAMEQKGEEIGEQVIVFPFQDQIVVLIEDELERSVNDRKQFILNIADTFLSELESKWPDYKGKIGVGKWYENSIHLNKSYQEAKLALQFGNIWFEQRTIYHIHDLGILRLLTYIHQEILSDFSDEYLSLLQESDENNGTEYIDTLKAYIQYQGVINDVSNYLHVHPNTLRNRIKRMEEITGVDFQDSEEFINLIVAVKILSLKN